MESIVNLIDKLLDKNTYKHTCEKCYEDDTYIYKHFHKDKVEEYKLVSLIKRSRRKNKLKLILLDILFYIDETGITDDVIYECMNYHGKFRNTLITQLSHLWLKEEQLENIVTRFKVPEVYCKLFLLKVCDENNSVYDLSEFVSANKQYLKEIFIDKKYFIGRKVSSERIELAESLIKKLL